MIIENICFKTHHYQSKDYVILVKDPPTASVRANQTHGGKNGGTGTAGNQLEPVFQPSVTAGAGKKIMFWDILSAENTLSLKNKN